MKIRFMPLILEIQEQLCVEIVKMAKEDNYKSLSIKLYLDWMKE